MLINYSSPISPILFPSPTFETRRNIIDLTMSFVGNLPSSAKLLGGGGADPSLPLNNLAAVQIRIDSVHEFLSASLSTNTLIQKADMDAVSSEISSAIHQIIVNGAALLACSQTPKSSLAGNSKAVDLKSEVLDEETSDGYEILELDAVELLAEHVHFCEICGKGFKRDANLRMHMRAHGNQFKTPEALAKPESVSVGAAVGRKTRFSCPYVGCNRNKQHKKFRPLKSAICVKNHFKRSHCPKMYSCDRCNKKKFSVMADLKCHLKHCGEANKWKCSCGTSFSRKDKLFGHVALFEGHMPAVKEEEKPLLATVVKFDEEESLIPVNGMDVDDGFLDGFNSPANYCFQDLLCSPADSGVDGFFNF